MTVTMPITGNSIPGGGTASREAEYRGQGGGGMWLELKWERVVGQSLWSELGYFT